MLYVKCLLASFEIGIVVPIIFRAYTEYHIFQCSLISESTLKDGYLDYSNVMINNLRNCSRKIS